MAYVQYLGSVQTEAYTDYTVSISTSGLSTTAAPANTDDFSASGRTAFLRTGFSGNYNYADVSTDSYQNGASLGTSFIGSNSGSYIASYSGNTYYLPEGYSADGKTYLSSENAADTSGQGTTFSYTSWTATGSWNSDSSSFEESGGLSISSYYSAFVGYTGFSDEYFTSYTYVPMIAQFSFAQKTTLTNSSVYLNKTTQGSGTYYGPLDQSSVPYSIVTLTGVPSVLSGIKTLVNANFYWDVEYKSKTFYIGWTGYNPQGNQSLGLVYSTTAENIDISQYAKILKETDSFSLSNKSESIAWETGTFGEESIDTYTLTLDYLSSTFVPQTKTTLQRATFKVINSFSYGFIKTQTQSSESQSWGKYDETYEFTSASKQNPYILNNSNFQASKVSYSYVQGIATTSQYTKYVEILYEKKATSFAVRSLTTITTGYTYQENNYQLSGLSISYSYAPKILGTYLQISQSYSSNPDTFYIEKAFYGSFADPNYASAYKGYSPDACSLVFLALVPLYETWENIYPSWVSVYNGTASLVRDRAETSLESVTLSQSSSFVSIGATNVYQTISYFIGNNPNSATTKTTSVAMMLASVVDSVFRPVRTSAENLESAYSSDYPLPCIPLNGANVVFTEGLQGEASYNINKLPINAYTDNRTIFAQNQVSFAASVSSMSPIFRNKITIFSAYGDVEYDGYNTFGIDLSRFYDGY